MEGRIKRRLMRINFITRARVGYKICIKCGEGEMEAISTGLKRLLR
jgi:hypothetical protein